MASVRFGQCRHIKPGVIATMKGPGVTSKLMSVAESIAASANAAAADRRGSIDRQTMHIMEHYDRGASPYAAKAKRGRFTSLAVVRPVTREGRYDQNQHHTLDSYNH